MKNTTRILLACLLIGPSILRAEPKARAKEKADPAMVKIEFRLMTVPDGVKITHAPQRVEALSPMALQRLLEQEGVDVLSAPSVMTLAGQDAEIFIGTEGVQYMEKKGDLYALKEMERDVGLRIAANCETVADQPQSLVLSSTVRFSLMEGRNPLEGVNLPVGMPIVKENSIEIKATLKDGVWYVLDIMRLQGADQPAADALYIICRASQVDEEGEPVFATALDIKADKISAGKDHQSTLYQGNVRLEQGEIRVEADELVLRPAASGDRVDPVQIFADTIRFDKKDGSLLLKQARLTLEGSTLEAPVLRLLPRSAVPALEDKLNSIILPHLELQNAAIKDVVAFLVVAAQDHDPDKQGVNIVLHADVPVDRSITLSLTRIPLHDALRFITDLAGLKMEIREHAVMILKP